MIKKRKQALKIFSFVHNVVSRGWYSSNTIGQWLTPHSTLKCNELGSRFEWGFKTQTLSGAVVEWWFYLGIAEKVIPNNFQNGLKFNSGLVDSLAWRLSNSRNAKLCSPLGLHSAGSSRWDIWCRLGRRWHPQSAFLRGGGSSRLTDTA